MNYEYFIAKRIIGSKAYKSSISAPIIKIGIAAIAIGIVVMMIAIATGIGLQQKIRDKVVAFNGHITITNYDSNNSQESVFPISNKQDFYPEFKSVEGFLIEGRLPNFEKKYSEEVLISQYLADRLGFKLGEDFQMLFSKEDIEKPPSFLKSDIVGIYNSGFQDLDKQYIIGNLRHIQRINKLNG